MIVDDVYFNIEINNNGTITNYTITVPDGNYDNSMLEHYLNTTYFYQSSVINDLNYIKFSIDPFNFKSAEVQWTVNRYGNITNLLNEITNNKKKISL